MLSEKEVLQFQAEGFLVINDVLSMDEVEALREAAASPEVMSEVEELGYHEKTVHMLNITTKHPAFLNLAKESRITDRVADLIGPDLQLHHSKLATKPPVKGKGSLFWHQDLAFFPHTNTDLVAVMVMLDDTTPENGCMQMVRGSHKLGLLNHSRDGYFAYTCQEEDQWTHESKIAEITPNAGGISIHHCLSLHTSYQNTSGRPRRGIVYQYRAADAYQLADNLWEDGGLQVRGKPSPTVRCEAGTFLLPRYTQKDFIGYCRGGRYLPPDWEDREREFGTVWNQEGKFAREQNRGQNA